MTDGAAERRDVAGLAILPMVTIGGIAALSWEVLWQLQASLALGASALGTALTLAATMAGFTAGSLTMGRALRRRPVAAPIRLYGALELVIGLSGLLLVPGFGVIEHIDTWVAARSLALAPIVHIGSMVALLGPPTFSMGATIPVFELIARRHRNSVAVLYGANTAGAAAGVLALSFVVLPALGVRHSASFVAGLNLLVFASAWLLPRPGATPEASEASGAKGIADRLRTGALPPVLVFGTGLVAFGLEVAWFRSLRAAFRSTTESFAIMLAAVLIPLALGARLVPWLRRRGFAPGVALACAGVAILLATPVVERMDLISRFGGEYHWILAKWLALALATMGPAMFFLGIVLPWYLEEFPDPAPAGRLYAANTFGAVVGALGAAWVLLPAVGFARTAWLFGALLVALAFPASGRVTRIAAAIAGFGALFVAVGNTSSIGRDRVQNSASLQVSRVLAYAEAPDSTVSAVVEHSGTRMLLIDGFVAATELEIASYMEWMGRLPMLLHPNPRSTLVIGFGTGRSTNAVREEGSGAIDVVDLSKAVFDMAPHFRSNKDVLDDPRVNAIVMDGRAWIRRSPRRYDVMTLEPMPPYFAGLNSLYTTDFYEIMASKLEPGGIAAQWLPIHLVSPFYARAIAATFVAVFPDSILWIDPVTAVAVLIGRREGGPTTPLGETWPGFGRHDIVRNLTDEQVRKGVIMGPEGLARYAAGGTLITDDNQLLAYSMMRAEVQAWNEVTVRVARANLEIIAHVAGRPPYVMPREHDGAHPHRK